MSHRLKQLLTLWVPLKHFVTLVPFGYKKHEADHLFDRESFFFFFLNKKFHFAKLMPFDKKKPGNWPFLLLEKFFDLNDKTIDLFF